MAQVIVRNLDDNVVARLKRRAKAHERRLDEELREIFVDAAKEMGRPARAELLTEIDRIRSMTPKDSRIDSTALIRADRDR
jgi:plasmid stability protein